MIQGQRIFGEILYFNHFFYGNINFCGLFYRYTMQENPEKVYAIVLRYPETNSINLYSITDYVTDKTKVKLLGYKKDIKVGEIFYFFDSSCKLFF